MGSLDEGTAYAFKAYSDTTCADDKALATAAAWATLPPKPSKPTLTVSLGDGKVRLASSVGGTAALTKWQYIKKAGENAWETEWSDIDSTSSTLSHTLTGLADGTAYKLKVRARNASGAGAASDASDAATPRAVTLTAGTATATGMTLTIANWSADWYWKHTTPAGGGCSSTKVAAGTDSVTVGSLDSNTAHTFKAYSDATCSDAGELATAASRATLPAKPLKPVLTVNLGSGKMRVASSVTGEASLTKWQYKKKKDGGSYDDDWTDVDGASTSLSHEVTGLTDGSRYQFKVRARNASGAGAESDESDETTLQPATLTAGSVTADGMTLTIRDWTKPWYFKHSAEPPNICTGAVQANTPSKPVTGLDSNTAYTFTAHDDGYCKTKLLATAAPFATLPPKPSKPTATAGSGSGELTLTASVGGGSAALTKWQYVKKEGENAWETDWTDISSTSKSLSHKVTGLTDGTKYLFKVRARNASGASAASDASDAATPRAPTLTASAATATGMTLTIAGHDGAWYWKYTTPAGGECSSSKVAAGTKAATPESLDSNTVYTFKAYGDGQCSTELATANSYATLPATPAKPTATAGAGSGTLVLSSSVTGTAAIEKWQYVKKEGENAWETDWTDVASTSKSLSHTLTGLTDGTKYRFKVRARNASGAGEASGASAEATPRAPALTAGTATADGMTLTIAHWSAAWRWKRTAPSAGDCSTEVAAGTDSATVGSLDSNTAYTFKAYSDNSCETELAAASPFATLPPKPAKPAAGAGSGTLTLTSSVTGTAAIEKWQYKKKKDAGNYDADWTDISSTSKTLSHTLTGLTDGAVYRFKVRARNASGAGAASDASDATTLVTATLTAGAAKATGMTLTIANWSKAWRWKQTAPSAGDCSSEVAAGTDSATVGSLDSNTAYTFKAYSDTECSTVLATAGSLDDPAGRAGEAGGHRRRRQRQAHPHVVGDGHGGDREVAVREEGGRERLGDRLDRRRQHLDDPVAHADRSHRRHEVPVQGAREERLGHGRGVGRFGRGHPAGADPDRGLRDGDRHDADHRELDGAWYYEYAVPSGGDCSSKVAAGTDSATVGSLDSNTAWTFKAYSDGNCSTELAAASPVRDPAAVPGDAGRHHRRRQRHAHPDVLGDGHGDADEVAVRQEGGRQRLGDGLDRHPEHLEEPVAHGDRSHRRQGVPVQGARAQRLGLRRGLGRLGRGHPAGADPDRGLRDGDRHDADRRPLDGAPGAGSGPRRAPATAPRRWRPGRRPRR